jgi:hypothetical protein
MIVGAGTWQALFSARSLGFQDRTEAVTIERQSMIPEEFLRRFGHVLYLYPPDASEFEGWITAMYEELLLPRPDVKSLAQQAVESELNCRWLENHLMALLRDPEVRKGRRERIICRSLVRLGIADSGSGQEPTQPDLPF